MTNDQDQRKNNEHLEILQTKAQTFFETEKLVHIQLKNRLWRRGRIVQLNPKYFILEERIHGRLSIFFVEIHDIQEFTPAKEVSR